LPARPRFAIYYAPEPEEPLAALGAAWLGYDAAAGKPVPQPATAPAPARLREVAAEPRAYGFHGTLKPPFGLAPGVSEAMLLDELRAFANARPATLIGDMRVAAIGGFLALVPVETPDAVAALAADCVRHFDRFRAPPDPAELTRRRSAGLTARQEELLRRWGYPYVMEEFRFHLTLTGRIDGAARARLIPVLESMFAADRIGAPVIRSLSIFRQEAPDQPFRIVARAPLSGREAPQCHSVS
jgi:putative phosphonate metabolism protein